MSILRRAAAPALALCAVFATAGPASALVSDDGRASQQEPGTLPSGASEFDFWLGTWKAGYTGVDKVRRFGDGVAVLETYKEGAFAGSSVNVYDAKTGMWTQTWLTNAGAYFQVTGKKEGNDIVLVGDFKDPSDGAVKLLRLSFVNITPTSFTQRYETSIDGGKTWKLSNSIPFTRRKK